MNIKKLLIIPLFITPIIGFSQSEKISDWQQIHPNVIFIESKDFNAEFEKNLLSLNQEFIVYTDEITIEAINQYESKANEKSHTGEVRNDAGNQLIKDWIGQNPSIKILKRSYYESLDKSKRLDFINDNALILAGEKLTITDIENYEINH